jgi:hypothetical protein
MPPSGQIEFVEGIDWQKKFQIRRMAKDGDSTDDLKGNLGLAHR